MSGPANADGRMMTVTACTSSGPIGVRRIPTGMIEHVVAIRFTGMQPGQYADVEVDYELPPRRIPILVEELTK